MELTLYSWDKSHLVMMYNLFNMLLTSVCHSCVAFVHLYSWRISMYSFLVMSFPGFGIRVNFALIKWVRKRSIFWTQGLVLILFFFFKFGRIHQWSLVLRFSLLGDIWLLTLPLYLLYNLFRFSLFYTVNFGHLCVSGLRNSWGNGFLIFDP